ncbi:junctional adhesion molecule-like protein [Labeo rohita]|uniref:Junctional adhesion molecule-like protein n=1 Tax=Labeo rohita TaxID=84645 RepID=A0A498NUQ7_LABRO|nr:junctional adhesion molecule-like protein [Labeo rohita]RXN35892.1 junctional adhesion molecule-like protein [Labeo rohita]
MLHFTDGCHVSDHMKNKEVTGYTGGSVLLPCSCTDPQSTVKTLRWYHQRENQWTKRKITFNQSVYQPINLQNTEKNVQRLNTQEGYRENNHKSHLNITFKKPFCCLIGLQISRKENVSNQTKRSAYEQNISSPF